MSTCNCGMIPHEDWCHRVTSVHQHLYVFNSGDVRDSVAVCICECGEEARVQVGEVIAPMKIDMPPDAKLVFIQLENCVLYKEGSDDLRQGP